MDLTPAAPGSCFCEVLWRAWGFILSFPFDLFPASILQNNKQLFDSDHVNY